MTDRQKKGIHRLAFRDQLRQAVGGPGAAVAGFYVGGKLGEKAAIGTKRSISIPSLHSVLTRFRRAPKAAATSAERGVAILKEKIPSITPTEVIHGGKRIRIAARRIGPVRANPAIMVAGALGGAALGYGAGIRWYAKSGARDAERTRKHLGIGGKPITPLRHLLLPGHHRLAYRAG